MPRYGFGEKTGESEKGNLAQYENGHVEASNQAFKWATSVYPSEPPAGAIGLALCDLAGVDLADHVDVEAPEVDYEAVHESFQSVEGIGEATASELVELLQDNV